MNFPDSPQNMHATLHTKLKTIYIYIQVMAPSSDRSMREAKEEVRWHYALVLAPRMVPHRKSGSRSSDVCVFR